MRSSAILECLSSAWESQITSHVVCRFFPLGSFKALSTISSKMYNYLLSTMSFTVLIRGCLVRHCFCTLSLLDCEHKTMNLGSSEDLGNGLGD